MESIQSSDPTWIEFFCGRCGHEEAFYGEVPDEYEFVCNCEESDDDR